MGKRKEKVPAALAKMRDWFDQKFVQGIENPVVKEPPPPPPPKPVRERKPKSESAATKPQALVHKPEIPTTKVKWGCPLCKAVKEQVLTPLTVGAMCMICEKIIPCSDMEFPEGKPAFLTRSWDSILPVVRKTRSRS